MQWDNSLVERTIDASTSCIWAWQAEVGTVQGQGRVSAPLCQRNEGDVRGTQKLVTFYSRGCFIQILKLSPQPAFHCLGSPVFTRGACLDLQRFEAFTTEGHTNNPKKTTQGYVRHLYNAQASYPVCGCANVQSVTLPFPLVFNQHKGATHVWTQSLSPTKGQQNSMVPLFGLYFTHLHKTFLDITAF